MMPGGSSMSFSSRRHFASCAALCPSSRRSKALPWAVVVSSPCYPILLWPVRLRWFAVPEVTRGIFPGIGGTQLLPRIVGTPFAKEMIFTGRRVPAPEAKAIGLVNHLVPAGQAQAKALEIATTIAQNGPIAVRQAKKAIAWGAETDLETGMMLAIEAYNSTVHTDDRLEGVRAFNERRPPRFQGR